MGGKTGKHCFLAQAEYEKYRPSNFFRLTGDFGWLCGGAMPLFKESLQYLKAEKIGLIVTLSLEQIKLGVNINHVPYKFEETSWALADDISEGLKDFELAHVPIVDSHPFYGNNATLFLKTIRDYHIDNPKKSIYVSCWSGRGRSAFAIIYALMKFDNLTHTHAYNFLCRYLKEPRISDQQTSFLNGEQLSDLDIYNSKPEIRTPKDHQCYDDYGPSNNRTFDVSCSDYRYTCSGCAVCRHECDNIVGEEIVEPVFKSLPMQTSEPPIVPPEKDTLKTIIPLLSDELRILSELHMRHSILSYPKPTKDTKYKFVTSFYSDLVSDMITLIKRIGDYIIYFDRNGTGMLLNMNVGHGSKAVRLQSAGIREGSPNDVLLYKDTDGSPILIGCYTDSYGIWRCNDNNREHLSCYNDYSSNLGWKFTLFIATNGRCVLNNRHGLQYASFKFNCDEYKLVLGKVPDEDMPLYSPNNTHIIAESQNRFEIESQLLIDSISPDHFDKVAVERYKYEHVSDRYGIKSIYSSDQYDDIVLIGHDYGRVSVWQS